MDIPTWLEQNKEMFDVTNNTSTAFIEYDPLELLTFKGEPVDHLAVVLTPKGDKRVINQDGQYIQSNRAEILFKWNHGPKPTYFDESKLRLKEDIVIESDKSTDILKAGTVIRKV